jgi:hypothetical protein
MSPEQRETRREMVEGRARLLCLGARDKWRTDSNAEA